MSRKRWLAVVIVAVLACLISAAAGALWMVQHIPAAARLVRGEPRAGTGPPAQRVLGSSLATASLTPALSPSTDLARTPGIEVSVSEPGMETRPAEAPRPAASATVTPLNAIVTPTLSLTPTLPPPTSTPRPAAQWIAFETTRGAYGDYEIYVMAPDGSRLANLTNSWADDLAPGWSPDGRHIAFVSLRDTLTGKSDLEGGNLYVLDFDPVKGRAVGEARRLTDWPGAEGWPAWSPDGKRIAFHSDRDGNFDIWVMNLDGSGLINLTSEPADDRYPAWSPDGSRIAFASTRSGNYDVWVVNSDGSHPVNLTRNPARDRYPIWSPDGRRMTFNTDRDGNQEIYIMNADGSKPINLTRTPKQTEGLADWSPDGRRVMLYTQQKRNKDIYVLDLATGKWINITNDPASDEYCAWWP